MARLLTVFLVRGGALRSWNHLFVFLFEGDGTDFAKRERRLIRLPKLPTHDLRGRGVEDRNVLSIADLALIHDAVVFGGPKGFRDVLGWRVIRNIFGLENWKRERLVQDMPVVAFKPLLRHRFCQVKFGCLSAVDKRDFGANEK
jgi:hypothetical protein